MAEMSGRATDRELTDLYFNLSLKTTEERKQIPFALFIIGKGMLNGEDAFQYLENKLKGGTS